MRRTLMVAVLAAALIQVQPATAAKFGFPDGVASGDVTRSTALLWTRTNRAGTVVAEVATDRRFFDVTRIVKGKAKEEAAFAVEVRVKRLDPGEHYYFRFVGPGGSRSKVGQLDTAPAPKDTGVTRFVYSGDSDGTVTAGENYRDEIAAAAVGMAGQKADFFVYLGDTIYSDSSLAPEKADTLGEYRAKHSEVRSIGALRRLLGSTSVVAQWDDHEVRNDYAGNPPAPFAVGGLTPAEVAAGQQAFRESFPIRESGGGATYRRLRWGRDLDLFVLDGRSYRTSPAALYAACFQPTVGEPDIAPTLPQPVRSSFASSTGLTYLGAPPPPPCLPAFNDPTRTMLGAEQEAWLHDGLQKSKATFKVIVNPVPIQELFAAPYDRWEAYPAERKELLTFIRDNGISGVAFTTTDTHATIVNPACITTLGPGGTYDCNTDTAPTEVIAGPMGTATFAAEINNVLPGAAPLVSGFIESFLHSPCVDIDEPVAWATAVVKGKSDTLTITPKRPGGKHGEPICSAPIVVKA